MSDGQIIAMILSGAFFVCFGIPLIYIYFYDIVEFFESVTDSIAGTIKAPFEKYIANKQMNCIHLWRRLDGDYSQSETVYRYKCVKCKSDKRLRESEAERFEKDFMSDY